MLPFTPEQFLAVFVNYNTAIWPIQIAAYLLGCIAVALFFRQTPGSDRVVAGILAVMWLWTGIVYHGLSFSVVNKDSVLSPPCLSSRAAISSIRGCFVRSNSFRSATGSGSWVGATFVAYAAVVYPLIGVAIGHRYPELPMFGVTPCPVTIFTFGLLLSDDAPCTARASCHSFCLVADRRQCSVLLDVSEDWGFSSSAAASQQC